MRVDVTEVINGLALICVCGVALGLAWSISSPPGWEYYGVLLAAVGFLGVVIATVARLLLDRDTL